jgi:hypothetical protein
MSFKASLPFHEVREGFAASERDPSGPGVLTPTQRDLRRSLRAKVSYARMKTIGGVKKAGNDFEIYVKVTVGAPQISCG